MVMVDREFKAFAFSKVYGNNVRDQMLKFLREKARVIDTSAKKKATAKIFSGYDALDVEYNVKCQYWVMRGQPGFELFYGYIQEAERINVDFWNDAVLLGTGKKKPKPSMVAMKETERAWQLPGYKIAIDDVDYATKFVELYEKYNVAKGPVLGSDSDLNVLNLSEGEYKQLHKMKEQCETFLGKQKAKTKSKKKKSGGLMSSLRSSIGLG